MGFAETGRWPEHQDNERYCTDSEDDKKIWCADGGMDGRGLARPFSQADAPGREGALHLHAGRRTSASGATAGAADAKEHRPVAVPDDGSSDWRNLRPKMGRRGFTGRHRPDLPYAPAGFSLRRRCPRGHPADGDAEVGGIGPGDSVGRGPAAGDAESRPDGAGR